jgi:Asp-tRNA(Asn)/Glu-tRNA(Gln) amidotransferase A subunit family amidase
MSKLIAATAVTVTLAVGAPENLSYASTPTTFNIMEASIEGIQSAILAKQLTSEQLVRMYLTRIKAYNGTCVKEPKGSLGPVTTIPNAGQINAISTLNLRPAARKALGFDAHKARSMTDSVDNNPAMPDALEVARELDKYFAKTGQLVGPLHGVVIAIKDQFDTFDMRTTSGADAPYANDRPPLDSTFATKLREAGAIIIGKSNMGEYAAGARSAFGGTFCNPYDTERSPGGSSGGSGSAVAANMATCAIGEESGPSIRSPAKNNNVVGISASEELVSRHGMIAASFMNDRTGPICRSVADAARVLDVISGYDPRDELTAFSVGRKPWRPYASFVTTSTDSKPLAGIRIGVVREYMNKKLFSVADVQSIDIIDRELNHLKNLGATLVDPGPEGELFQDCLTKYGPHVHNSAFVKQFPGQFPVDAAGKPTTDHIPKLVDMYFSAAAFPGKAEGKNELPSIRGIGPQETVGERRYMMERYLRERGDANIKTIQDLIDKSKFFEAPEGSGFMDKKNTLTTTNKEKTLDIGIRLQNRWALQQIALQCMAQLNVDALTYPTGNIPAPKLGRPNEPTINGRQANAWTLLGQNGFPAITVPAGFTTEVYDRVFDPTTQKDATDRTKLEGPVAAKLPVGIDFLGRPFDEATLIRIASAYELASKHRSVPPEFGPVKRRDDVGIALVATMAWRE